MKQRAWKKPRPRPKILNMGVAADQGEEPLEEIPFEVTRKALVVGGGLAGMTPALAIADSGFPVYLVEKDEHLGEMVKRLHYTLEGHRMQPHLANLSTKPQYHPGIQVMTNTPVLDFTRHAGNSRSTLVEVSRAWSSSTTARW